MRRTILWIAVLTLISGSLSAVTPHKTSNGAVPSPVANYNLIDISSTDLAEADLTRLEPLYTRAPSINNLGQIVYNKSTGGYVRDPNIGEYALGPDALKVYGHSINNEGDILVSINRPNDIEWMVWGRKSTINIGPVGKQHHIANLSRDTRAFFCVINDQGTVTGYKEINGKFRPLVWNRCEGLKSLGYHDNYDIAGFPRGINDKGTIVGYFETPNDSPPFLWNCCTGLDVLRNYRNLVDCQGWIELADMVITEENTIYGTYHVKYVSGRADPNDLNQYFMYRWDPKKNDFNMLKIKGMRITSINNANTVAGSYNGRAAIRREGYQPIDLNSLVKNQDSNWELLEATGINDRGQIVGYGKYKGQMHIFLLDPAM